MSGGSAGSEIENGFEDEEHPLQNTWCMWHDKYTGGSAEKYAASLKKLCLFSTIEVCQSVSE
jgi:hypothetical protein